MANVTATLLIETEQPIPLVCADGTGIAKGAALKIADNMVASLSTADEDYCGGIAGTEKIASDGMVSIDVYRGGIFKVTASGSITAGQTVTSAAAGTYNGYFSVSDATCVSSKTWGIALQSATDGQTFVMDLRPGAGANAFS